MQGYAVAAHDYARWLEGQERLEEALVMLEAALREGPDFGAMSRSALAWRRVCPLEGARRPPLVATADGGAGPLLLLGVL